MFGCKDPIYLSYEDLRKPIVTIPSREVANLGKIYVYKNLILANERNEGIHVFDNSDPSAPKYVLFIKIPGNLDIAVKDSYLFADSYIDLEVIDISNTENVSEVKRIKDMFPYDTYQNIPEDICIYEYDQSKGVVVGYKERTNENK